MATNTQFRLIDAKPYKFDGLAAVGDLCPDCRQSTISQRPDGELFCPWCQLLWDVLVTGELAEWEDVYPEEQEQACFWYVRFAREDL